MIFILIMFQNLKYEFVFNIYLHTFVYSLKLNAKMLYYHQSFMGFCYKALFHPVVHVCEFLQYRIDKGNLLKQYLKDSRIPCSVLTGLLP